MNKKIETLNKLKDKYHEELKHMLLDFLSHYDIQYEYVSISPKHQYNDEGLYSYYVYLDEDYSDNLSDTIFSHQSNSKIPVYQFGEEIEMFLNSQGINHTLVDIHLSKEHINAYKIKKEENAILNQIEIHYHKPEHKPKI